MAIWQTGITWAPPPELLNENFNGALKHVATYFASWARRLARAVLCHKKHPHTNEARIRSGATRGQHGLTPQQVRDRDERQTARRNYYMTVQLAIRLQPSNGKGKGKSKGKGTNDSVQPKAWDHMSRSDHWWLYEYWSGRLRERMDEAEAKCHKVQAPRFRMLPKD